MKSKHYEDDKDNSYQGSPRKAMNTDQMAEAFIKGAKSVNEGIEIKHVRLYDLDYKGCYGCLSCKMKNSKFHDFCAQKDGASEILKETAYADGLCIASPIYFGDITAQTKAFLERLFFPWFHYEDNSIHTPKHMPTAFIYTMNVNETKMPIMEEVFNRIEAAPTAFLSKPERVIAINTHFVNNYDKYEFPSEMILDKGLWNESHFNEELENAFNAGKRMAEKVLLASFIPSRNPLQDPSNVSGSL